MAEYLGLIEGFYGHPWSWQQRQQMATFLGEQNYHFYIYAPKSDPKLRSQWCRRHDLASERALQGLASACVDASIEFGIGLSPLGLQDNWDAGAQRKLTARLGQLLELNPDIVCLLFDDAPALGEQLGPIQAKICNFAAHCLPDVRLIMCPSFYSTDPMLENLFGARPQHYWKQLGSLLDPQWQVFWTGEQVCSSGYGIDALEKIGEQLQRKPMLWDNYPVNDGARSSRFLHLDAYRNRPAELLDVTSGHAVNPMNQANLSRIPLATLPQVYARGASYDPGRAFADACLAVEGEQLSKLLGEDLHAVQALGLDGLSSTEKQRLRARYAQIASESAREIVAWLDGHYVFDPNCLTG